jgi:hypothetical protein
MVKFLTVQNKSKLKSGIFAFFACFSQKGKCAVYSMAHRGQRSQESIEFRKARQFCFEHSKSAPSGKKSTKENAPNPIQKIIAKLPKINSIFE